MDYSTIKVPARMEGLAVPTVWGEFTPLAVECGAYNLGQGFPDWSCPDFCKNAVKRAVEENYNQYGRPAGHLPLVQVLAKEYSSLLGRKVNPLTEITVSSGATEGLYAIWQALLCDGEDVVIFEPAFDVYEPQIKMAGGKCTYIPLTPDSAGKWVFDAKELEKSITNKTRAILLNTPHNPTGKVFNAEEIKIIRTIMDKHPGLILVTDEVYERIIFDDNKHIYPASIPGLWDRTLTVSSQGKTFSTTGWKIGWVVGPQELISRITFVNQNVHYCIPTVLQEAIAEVLQKALEPYEGYSNYYTYLAERYQKKRDKLVNGLRSADITPFVPEGGIFVVGDTSRVKNFEGQKMDEYMEVSTPACPEMTRDWAFCRWLTIEKGVCAIPPSTFYTKKHKHLAANLARFAFCKEDETIEGASVALHKLKLDQSESPI